MQKYSAIALTAIVYILEAHFVERNDCGEIVDGWPIGYFDFEYPQHRSLEDRKVMLTTARREMNCINHADVVCMDSWTNDFNRYFAAWPDQAYAIDLSGKLIFRGILSDEDPGFRDVTFSKQLEQFMLKQGIISHK
jgi:hypothetical protein